MAKKKSKKKVAEIDSAIRKEWLAKATDSIVGLADAPKSIKSDPEIVLAAVKEWGWALQYASKSLKSDPKIVLSAVKQDGMALEYASNSLQSDPKIVLSAVKQDGNALEFASKSLQSDPKIVLAAVKNGEKALEYASKNLQSEPKIASAALRSRTLHMVQCWAPDFLKADEKFTSDSKFVLDALKVNASLLEYVGKKFRSDPKFALVAVKQWGSALEYASKELRNDPKIVLAAVKQSGEALEYATKSLKSDPKVVLAAVKQNGWALEYVSKDLRDDPKIVFAAVLQYGRALEFGSKSLKSDPKIVLAAVKQEGDALRYATKDLKSDPKIVLAAVKQDASALQYATKDLKSDPKIVLTAVKKNGLMLEFASKSLQSDSMVVSAAVKQNPEALAHAQESCLVGLNQGKLGIPTKCSASYGETISTEREDGIFVGVGEDSVDVKGYIIITEKSWGDLIWELPKSTGDCLDAIEQKYWIWCDESSESSIAFDESTIGEDGEQIERECCTDVGVDVSDDYEFEGGNYSLLERSTSSSPDTITIEYDSGFKIEFSAGTEGVWKAKLKKGTTALGSFEILDYEQVLEMVRCCLEDPNPKDTFDSIIAKLLELNN